MPAFPKTLVLRASLPLAAHLSHTHTGEGDVEIYVMVTQSLPLLNSPSPLTACGSEGEFKIGGLLMFLQSRGGPRQTQCSLSVVSICYIKAAVICMCPHSVFLCIYVRASVFDI